MVMMPSSDGHGAFASAVLGKGLPFLWSLQAATFRCPAGYLV
jgi:hypothetical protein